MTRDSGQLTTRQAILGGTAILAVVIGIVAALALLLEREEQLPPLEAPAEPAEPVGERPCPPTPEPLATVGSDELIECPETYDGQLVRYRGEAVRAILRRGDRAWVHLNDDPYALDLGPLPSHRTAVGGNSGTPVTIPVHIADQITHVGDARHQGDIIELVGTYRRTHPADHGGPAIHTDDVRIDQQGRPVARPVTPARVIVAVAVALLAIVITAAPRLRTALRGE